jgi:hypothetical protein
MREKRGIGTAVILLTALWIFAACASREAQRAEVTFEVMAEEDMAFSEAPAAAAEPPAMEAMATAVPATTGGESSPGQARLIIKDGRMVLLVGDTVTAVNRATQLAVELGGYVIGQNLFDGEQGFKFATMRLAVPVDQFEVALRQLRQLGEVTDEASSGEDVTEEFVDLNARLTNLQATRARLLDFLDAAETIDEILEVNEELNKVEEEIAVLQGRLNFLRDRAAFSTIDLTLNPLLPTPTPSPTPTATPLPTPSTWLPGDTAQTAVVQLQNTAQTVADYTIFYGILCGPWLLLLLIFVWIALRIRRWLARNRIEETTVTTIDAPQETAVAEGGSNDEA